MTTLEQKQQIFLCLELAKNMNLPTTEEIERAAKTGIAELCVGDLANNLVIANLLLRGGGFASLIPREKYDQLLDILDEAKKKHGEMTNKPLAVTRFLDNLSEASLDPNP